MLSSLGLSLNVELELCMSLSICSILDVLPRAFLVACIRLLLLVMKLSSKTLSMPLSTEIPLTYESFTWLSSNKLSQIGCNGLVIVEGCLGVPDLTWLLPSIFWGSLSDGILNQFFWVEFLGFFSLPCSLEEHLLLQLPNTCCLLTHLYSFTWAPLSYFLRRFKSLSMENNARGKVMPKWKWYGQAQLGLLKSSGS